MGGQRGVGRRAAGGHKRGRGGSGAGSSWIAAVPGALRRGSGRGARRGRRERACCICSDVNARQGGAPSPRRSWRRRERGAVTCGEERRGWGCRESADYRRAQRSMPRLQVQSGRGGVCCRDRAGAGTVSSAGAGGCEEGVAQAAPAAGRTPPRRPPPTLSWLHAGSLHLAPSEVQLGGAPSVLF